LAKGVVATLEAVDEDEEERLSHVVACASCEGIGVLARLPRRPEIVVLHCRKLVDDCVEAESRSQKAWR
jgi:hypothetical protein